MGPFDLRGPQFLVFYAGFALLVLAGLALYHLVSRRAAVPAGQLTDPYLVALLRGGPAEALRVTAISLLDRGLLRAASTTHLVADDAEAQRRVRRTIEQEVLGHFSEPLPAESIEWQADRSPAAAGLDADLGRMGIQRKVEDSATWIAIALLLGVAGLKVAVALSRGRTNVLFLMFGSLAAAVLAYAVGRNTFRSPAQVLVDDLKVLFSSLRARAASITPGGARNDLSWLVALWGTEAVSAEVFPDIPRFFPPPPPPKPLFSTSRDSGSGSSCGSGSSSCGSSGCGGGGCGGGCGGCGS